MLYIDPVVHVRVWWITEAQKDPAVNEHFNQLLKKKKREKKRYITCLLVLNIYII